ncbi:MAG: hypothetical protein A2Y33_08870 [Spirochaetes bacterium GWF1_51_8]|nr:MAG: hypothetical protein A2Y33_08870 [Spirochaetes bacterium GWF1_51_8]
MRYGFFGHRGINEFLNENGEGFFFSLLKDGKSWSKFFLNVGMPDRYPAFNTAHKDDPSYCSEIKLGPCSFTPFYAKYSIFDNTFEWIQYKHVILLKAHLVNPADFHANGLVKRVEEYLVIGGQFFIRGIDFELSYLGDIELVIADKQIGFIEFEEYYAKAKEELGTAIFKERPLEVARGAVFYNLAVAGIWKSKFYVPVNKAWSGFMSALFGVPEAKHGPLLFAWDASLSSIILSRYDTELAKLTLQTVLECITPDGRIPQIVMRERVSNRSNPPVWFLAAKEIYDRTEDVHFIWGIFPALVKNYKWFKANRMNEDYTFSWGSDNEDDETLLRLTGKTGAVLESGLDNSPIFDEMGFANGKLDYACIDLTGMMALAAEILLEFSRILSLPSGEFVEDLIFFGKSLNEFFDWNTGTANSFKRAGLGKVFAKEITPLSFYPLLSGLVEENEVKLLEGMYLSKHFQNQWEIPSLSIQSRDYLPDGDYWRGRIWPPINFLAAWGFKRHGSDIYRLIKESSERLLMTEWLRHNHIHENYSAISGEGEPSHGIYARSCPFYSWGGLLGIMD